MPTGKKKFFSREKVYFTRNLQVENNFSQVEKKIWLGGR